MKTAYTLLLPSGKSETGEFELDVPPGLSREAGFELLVEALQSINPSFRDTTIVEHLPALYEGRQTDMFVDEDGQWMQELARNEVATTLYKAYCLKTHGRDYDLMPAVFGTVVLCHQPVLDSNDYVLSERPYKSVAERRAESRAKNLEEAERRNNLTPEQQREESRQRSETRKREEER